MPTQITYNGSPVGSVKDGKITLLKFNQDIWRHEVYKYDILHELQAEFNPKKKKLWEKLM